MTRFISATYHPNIKAAEFIADDGRHLIRTGGSLPWRTHNIGNLVSPELNGAPAPKKTTGYIGFAKPATSNHYYFIFPDEITGRTQLKANLLRLHKDKTLDKLVASYAPEHDGNDTDAYTRKLSKLAAIDTNHKVKDLSDQQLESLIDGIARLEGYHADVDTRKEVWVNVSNIQATDGTRPIEGEEIVLRANGKETIFKSNASGQFGAIPHGKESQEVLHKTADGNLKKVGELPRSHGQNWSLLVKLSEYFGSTAPIKPPADAPQKKTPAQYIVQPHDSLSKIAKRFNTTVDDLKQTNRLTSDKIFPGQVLGINGAAPKVDTADPPKMAAKSPATSTHEKMGKPLTSEINTTVARSKKGTGEPLALIKPGEGFTPWMKFATEEARRFKGANEAEIEKSRNYHIEIKDDKKTLIGTDNAWCAAFVNWCLLKAQYPIRNPKDTGYVDWNAAIMRADGFNRIKGQKTEKKQKYDAVPFISNPLFVRISQPTFGSIGVVTNSSGRGLHVGFVYARADENHIILLGGNQNSQINFTSYNEKATPASTTIINGKAAKRESEPNHLSYFIPAAYTEQHKKQSSALPTESAEKLNISFEIKPKHGKSTR